MSVAASILGPLLFDFFDDPRCRPLLVEAVKKWGDLRDSLGWSVDDYDQSLRCQAALSLSSLGHEDANWATAVDCHVFELNGARFEEPRPEPKVVRPSLPPWYDHNLPLPTEASVRRELDSLTEEWLRELCSHGPHMYPDGILQRPPLEHPQSPCSEYPQCRKQFWASVGVTVSSTDCIDCHSASLVRQASVRSRCLILLNTISIGFRSGL